MLCGKKRKKLNIKEDKTMDTRWILCPICGSKNRDKVVEQYRIEDYR